MAISITLPVNPTAPAASITAAVPVNAPISTPVGQQGGSATALYLNLGISETYTGPLGLRTPQNAEDASALLSQVELLLEQTNSKLQDGSIASKFGQAHQAAQTALANELAAEVKLKEAQDKLAATQAKLTTAQEQQATLQDQSTTLGGQIATLDTTIAGLQTDVHNNVAGASDKLAAAQAQRATLVSSKQSVDTQLATANAEVTSLQAQVSDLETKTLPQAQEAVKTLSSAVAAAYSQLGLTIANALSEQTAVNNRSADQSVRLELGFENVKATEDKFRANALEVDTTEAKQRGDNQQQLLDDQTVNRLVLGLVAGVAYALDALKQNAAAPLTPPLNTTAQVNDRLRFAL